MSPEQARGEPLDGRTDIFSLGAVLYELATGRPAFPGKTSAIVFKAILDQTPPPPTQIEPSLPPQLDQIVDKALEKDRDLRYQHAADLRTDLNRLKRDTTSGRQAVKDTSAQTASGSTDARGRAGSRKKRLAAGSVALLALALGGGWWAWKHRPAEKREMVQRQLTASSSDNPVTGAAISRDGRYLAYSDNDGVAIQEIENGDTHKLPSTVGVVVMDWFPDGLHLLVRDGKQDLWTLFMGSGEKHKLASNVFVAALSPDGSQVAFFRGLVSRELWTMPVVGGEPQVRFAVGENEALEEIAWAPDGQSIAYISSSFGIDKPCSLVIRNLAEGKSRLLLTDSHLSIGGGASVKSLPDGRIVFEVYKEGNATQSDLWALSLDSNGANAGNPVRLTNTTGMYIPELSASTDGKRLAVLFIRGPWSIFVANVNNGGERLENPLRLTNDAWNNWPRAWAPDSQTLFYDSLRVNRSIYKRSLSSDSAAVVLAGPENYEMWAVSPDGMWFIITANRRVPGKWRLLRVPVAGGTPEVILTPAGVAEVHCAPTGSRGCVLSEDVGGQKIFSLVDPVRGRLEELARLDSPGELLLRWSLSPEGSKIALVKVPADNVQVLDLQSKQVHVIHPTPSQSGLQAAAWSADGKQILLSGFPDERGRLLEMDADGHTRLLLANPTGWIGYPVPSPDGKRLAYIYSVNESNVTLLEHF